jgi:hypothetical protein
MERLKSTFGKSPRSVRVAVVIVLASFGLSALSVPHAAEMEWRPLPGAGQTRVEGGRLLLELAAEGTIGLKSTLIPVTPNARMHLAFAFTSEQLSAVIGWPPQQSRGKAFRIWSSDFAGSTGTACTI